MFGSISEEVEVKASITETWDVYSTLKVVTILQSELDHIYGLEVVDGDGGVDTIVKVTPRSGVITAPSFKERIRKIDNAKRVKEVEIIEGGYLDLGYSSYRITIEIKEKESEDLSCILRATIEYEANEDASVATIEPLMNVFEVVNKHIQNNKS